MVARPGIEPPLKIRPHGVHSVEAFLLGHGWQGHVSNH